MMKRIRIKKQAVQSGSFLSSVPDSEQPVFIYRLLILFKSFSRHDSVFSRCIVHVRNLMYLVTEAAFVCNFHLVFCCIFLNCGL